MKILSWNVNGIRSVFSKTLGQVLSKHDPSILLVQEVKCNDRVALEKIFSELGYMFDVSMAEKNGYSGTLIAWKPEVSSKATTRLLPISDRFKSEGRAIEINISGTRIWNLYLPSGSSSDERQQIKMEALSQLTEYVGGEKIINSDVLLCGDFNICHKEIDIHHPQVATKRELSGFLPEERDWFSDFLGLGLVDTFRARNEEAQTFSWWSYRARSREKNLGWRIDYMLATPSLNKRIQNIEYLTNELGSDHCPMIAQLES